MPSFKLIDNNLGAVDSSTKVFAIVASGVGVPGEQGPPGGSTPIPANTMPGNNTGVTATPLALTPAEVRALLSLDTTYLALAGGTLTGQLIVERDVPTNVAFAASVLNASLNGTIQYRFQRTNADFLGSLVAAWRGGTTNNRINIETYGSGDSVDPLTAVRGTANGSALALRSTYALAWSSTANASTGTIDVQIVRDAANTLALRNALNPQALLIENTWTSATNRETAYLRWAGNVFFVGTEKGTLGGSAQRMEFQTDGITRVRIDNDYQVRIGDQATNAPSLFTFAGSNIASNGPGRGISLFGRNNVAGGVQIGLGGDTFTSTSTLSVLVFIGCSFVPTGGNGSFTTARVAPIINQTGGANGITRGISVEPALTSAADWRSFDTQVNSGFAYHSSGTAPSRLGGTLTVSGTIRTDTIGGGGAWAQIRSSFNVTNPDILIENSVNGVIARFRNDGNFAIGGTSPAGRFHVQGINAGITQTIIQAAASQTANLTEWQNSSGGVLASIGPAGQLSLTGNLEVLGTVSVGTYTTGTLPSASANSGRLAQVTDSSVTTNGSVVAGGGVSRVPVFSNGTNWLVGFSAGASGGSSLTTQEVIVNFGTGATFITVTVPATWVTATSKLQVILSGESTVDHDPEDYVLEQISGMVTNIQNGIGFDLLCCAPNGTHGQYKLLVRG